MVMMVMMAMMAMMMMVMVMVMMEVVVTTMIIMIILLQDLCEQSRAQQHLSLHNYKQLPSVINLQLLRHIAGCNTVKSVRLSRLACKITTTKATAHNGALTTALIKMPLRSK
jgi:hypothetical protein